MWNKVVCSITVFCLTLCSPIDCSMPGFPVPYYLLEFAQIHIRWVDDPIQPFHPLVTLFSSCLQSFSASGSFPVSQLFSSDGQNIWASLVLPMNTRGFVPLGLTGLISLLSKGLSRVFSSTIVQKHQFLASQPPLWSSSHIYTWLLEKPYLWLDRLVGKVMSLFFNMLSRFVIAFLPRRKCLLIVWLQSPSTVILEPKKVKSATISTFSSTTCCEVMRSDAMILIFWMLSFKPAFSFLFHLHQEAL